MILGLEINGEVIIQQDEICDVSQNKLMEDLIRSYRCLLLHFATCVLLTLASSGYKPSLAFFTRGQ